ncbi:MAG: AMP-binding protein [Anaerolineae bacterium]|nr:AMP-binding protein [Anaerolineae bacterium]
MNVVDYLLPDVPSDRTAIITEHGSHTYGEVVAATNGIARTLQDFGIKKGDRVGLLANNNLFWVASYLGIMKLGAIAVPFAPTRDPRFFEGQMALTTPGAFCLENRFLSRIAGWLDPALPLIVDTHKIPASAEGRQVVIFEPGEPLDSAPINDREDVALLNFTSGSTGAPRAVMVSHRNIIANSDGIIEYLALDENERIMVILPFYYCFGASLLHTHLRVGGIVVLNNRFAFPQAVLDHMQEAECTGIAGVPRTYQILLRNSEFPNMEFPHLKKIQQAGGKLQNVYIQELRAAHPHADYYLMYGQTEATARLSYLPPELLDVKLGSIGKGMPGVRLEVLDEEGNPVPPGVTGEIVAHGDNIALGYWQDPEGTAKKFVDGTLRTTDLAQIDEEGFIYVVDRAGDFLKPGGHRVASKLIENYLCELPEIVSAVAVGVPDELMGEAVRVFVTLKNRATITGDDVMLHCKRVMETYMVPREIIVLDTIPQNSSGKVNRPLLKKGDLDALKPRAIITNG